jgi:mevalonate kinase
MMSTRVFDFTIKVPAKWVLTGEHSVLRGADALAFPHPRFALELTYQNKNAFSITPNPFQSQIKSLIGRSLEFLGLPDSAFSSGEIEITSEIPIGAGLGSSAALCVAISRLVIWRTGSDPGLWVRLATHLEDVFHGKSSGMDVSVIAQGQPVLFSMAEGARVLQGLGRMPKFELYDSGIRGSTRDCIERVKHWQKQNPHLQDVFDQQMRTATETARAGLQTFQSDSKQGELKLKKAIELAGNCFETWGLLTPELSAQKYDLLKQGALAVKLTGAGLGGFWIALWPSS